MNGEISLIKYAEEKEASTICLRDSRHPMYVTTLIVLIGVGIASASWLVLLFTALYMAFTAIAVPAEERFLLQQYGEAYREYINRTSRWIGIPK